MEINNENFPGVEELSEEKQNELSFLFDNIDAFADEMKKRFVQKSIEGRQGWNGPEEEIIYQPSAEIESRIERLEKVENIYGAVSIGIANWAFIDWFRKTLFNPATQTNTETVRFDSKENRLVIYNYWKEQIASESYNMYLDCGEWNTTLMAEDACNHFKVQMDSEYEKFIFEIAVDYSQIHK